MHNSMQANAHNEVTPITPPAAWIGGKRVLSKRLSNMISNIDHIAYVEPFVGMGGVFFKRTTRPKAEIINDASGEVINLFRILQRHYPQFMDTIKFQITSRREFERLANTDPATLTDLEWAARFLYLQKLAFGGKVRDQHFGVTTTGSARSNLNRLTPMLEDVHERLAGVVIENLDWKKLIPRYDRHKTLFYLDPPYWGNERDYGDDLFDRSQFEIMANLLKNLKGRFILSINDRPQVREMFDGFNMEEVSVKYTVGGKHNTKQADDLIIANVERQA